MRPVRLAPARNSLTPAGPWRWPGRGRSEADDANKTTGTAVAESAREGEGTLALGDLGNGMREGERKRGRAATGDVGLWDFFFFFIFKKYKISKIYGGFKKFQK